MANAVRFKHTDVPRQSGELGRFKVVQGPDLGATYVVTGPHVTLGRGEECDILISDLKASRIHADILFNGKSWVIKDKGSANGILYNGNVTRGSTIKRNDVITVGETTLEFTTAEAGTGMLVAPPRTMSQIQAEQNHLREHKEKLRSMGLANLFRGRAQTQSSPQPKKNTIAIIAVAVGAVVFFIPDNKSPVKTSIKKNFDPAEMRNLAEYLPGSGDSNRAADTFFKDGFREYLAGNYNRAQTQFETVLQVQPCHTMARLYLENSRQKISQKVEFYFNFGRKAHDSGKLRESRGHYENILHLLYKSQADENFVKAREAFEKVDREIKGLPDLDLLKKGGGPTR